MGELLFPPYFIFFFIMGSVLDFFGGAAGAIAGLGSSVFNYFSQKEQNALNKELYYDNWTKTFESQENQFYYNKALQSSNNRFQREMFDAANAYNDPSAVRSRLSAAGMNPDLAYNTGSGFPAPSVPSGSSGSVSSPTAGGAPSMATYKIDPLTAAQIANIDADTALKKSQGTGQDISNDILSSGAEFKKQLMEGDVTLQGLKILQASKDLKLSDKRYDILCRELTNLEYTTENIQASTNAYNGQARYTNALWAAQEARNNFKDEIAKAEYSDLLNKLGISSTDLLYCAAKYASELSVNSAQAQFYREYASTIAKLGEVHEQEALKLFVERTGMHIQNSKLLVDLGLLEKYGEAERILKMLGMAFGTIEDGVYSADRVYNINRRGGRSGSAGFRPPTRAIHL